jgi:hypothetical protein
MKNLAITKIVVFKKGYCWKNSIWFRIYKI